MEPVLVALVIVAAIAVAATALVRALRTRPEGQRPRPWSDTSAAGETVALDLQAADPEDAAVQRLVRQAGLQALRADPELERVRVVDRDGVLLGEVERHHKVAEVELPDALHEPHLARRHGPAAVRSKRPGIPAIAPDDEEGRELAPRRRPVADRFQLPAAVEAELRRRDDAVELIRAILVAGGHEPAVDRDVVAVGDLAIVVVANLRDGAAAALNHAFLRWQEARKPQGLIVRLEWVNASELRHREAAAPWVRHVDSSAIQRMADAVAVGAEPLAFAVAPRVVGQ